MSTHPTPRSANVSHIRSLFDEVSAAYRAQAGTWSITDPQEILRLSGGNPLYALQHVYFFQYTDDGNERVWKLVGRSEAGFYVYIDADRPLSGFRNGGGGEMALVLTWDHLTQCIDDEAVCTALNIW